MAMLSKVGQANVETRVPGTWNLVILHHTDCGMTDLAPYPDLLAEYFEIPTQQLPSKAVTDPIASVGGGADSALVARWLDDGVAPNGAGGALDAKEVHGAPGSPLSRGT
jgi:hypothetical protein